MFREVDGMCERYLLCTREYHHALNSWAVVFSSIAVVKIMQASSSFQEIMIMLCEGRLLMEYGG